MCVCVCVCVCVCERVCVCVWCVCVWCACACICNELSVSSYGVSKLYFALFSSNSRSSLVFVCGVIYVVAATSRLLTL